MGQAYPPPPESVVAPVFVAARAYPTVDRARASESGDNYGAVVARLDQRWRVVDSLEIFPVRQWVLQTRKSERRWEGRSYCQRRSSLEVAIAWRVGPAAVALILHLPARIGG